MSKFQLCEKRELIDWENKDINISDQCKLLDIKRSSLYYKAVEASSEEVIVKNIIDKIYTKYPFFGSRRIKSRLNTKHNISIGRKLVQRYMREMGIQGICPKKNLSKRNHAHKIYPYLLGNMTVKYPRQVFAVDITYIGISRGWMYLVAIIDWFSRYVVSWELDQTLEIPFVLEAVERAIKNGAPEILNSDQGSHFTSPKYIQILENNEVKVSMDHKGRAFDNIFIERLWRSVKYEDIYLKDYGTPREVRNGICEYFKFYNYERPHQSLDYKTPANIYYQ